jgi:hypothetical protein
MRPITFTRSQPTASGTSVAAAQLLNSTAVTINGTLASGGVATYTVSAYPTVTADANATGKVFTVVGTRPGGDAQTATITFAGASGTVTASLAFATVTGITASAATSATISVGNAASGYTDWMPLDIYTPNQVTTISGTTFGTVDYSVEYTNEDPFDRTIQQQAVAHPVATLTNASTSITAFTTTLMRAIRLKINSGGGSVRFTAVQQSTK